MSSGGLQIKAEIEALDAKIEAAHNGIAIINAKTAAKTRRAQAKRDSLDMLEVPMATV